MLPNTLLGHNLCNALKTGTCTKEYEFYAIDPKIAVFYYTFNRYHLLQIKQSLLKKKKDKPHVIILFVNCGYLIQNKQL